MKIKTITDKLKLKISSHNPESITFQFIHENVELFNIHVNKTGSSVIVYSLRENFNAESKSKHSNYKFLEKLYATFGLWKVLGKLK